MISYMTTVAPNRRSYDAGGLRQIFIRTARVIPAFMLLAISSCVLGRYAFRIPLEQLGVAAVVPCVVGFAIMRILAVLMPRSRQEITPPSASFRVFGILAVLAAFIALDFLVATPIYHGLGLKETVVGALRIAEWAAVAAFGFVILALVMISGGLWVTMLGGALTLLRSQTQLTDIIPSPPWNKRSTQ